MTLKQLLYNHCESFIDKRLETVKNTIAGIQQALLTETKSTAGDKHETGRAMLQLEREKAGNQLAEIQKLKHTLQLVNSNKQTDIISLGSIVLTDQANYFIAISAGEIVIKKDTYFAISASTPIGKLLLSRTSGDRVNFNGKNIQINEVL